MLTKDYKKRPSAKEAWEDPWIQSRYKSDIEDSPISISTLDALSSFRTIYKLQQATLSYIAANLTTNAEISELKNAFIVLDSNGDGHLSMAEIKMGYANIKLSNSIDVKEILSRCDIDMNGMVDYSEFITATIDWSQNLTQNILETAFKAYDVDRSGTISITEVREFLGGYSELEREWAKIIKEIDSNGDGEIDLQEFKQMMKKFF
jgi:calcium-dependent protein kinase